MLQQQKALFNLPAHITYLNGAYMSPQLKTVEEAGISAVQLKSHPHRITAEHFFDRRSLLLERFGQLLNANPVNCAIIPSVSYGMANVANNIKLHRGDEILLVDEQFPSNVYPWKSLAKKYSGKLNVITPPSHFKQRGQQWNQAILDAITSKTKVVAMPQIHWADGTLFNLMAIRQKTKEVGALLVIDGTQSIGALPFSVKEIQPDALICGGYKWLLGPYALGMAYYGDAFLDGEPIEDSWMNRFKSEDFTNLTQYQDQFQAGAARFSVGESSNFILVPMLTKAIEQLLAWEPKNIQAYCKTISQPAINALRSKGYLIEEEAYSASHLFGVYLPEHSNMENIKEKLTAKNIIVSYRGKAIRVSPNVYNTPEDFNALVSQF